MKFKQYLVESEKITIYHGGSTLIKDINPKFMMLDIANSQEGIGIYFSSVLDVAQSYGKNVVQAKVSPKDFIESRKPFSKLKNGIKLLEYLNQKDQEDFYYLITDYGFEIPEPEDIEDYHIQELYNKLKNEEIRNISIELSQYTSPVYVAEAWRKYIPYIGLKNSKLNYYIVIKDIKLEPYKG